MAWSVAAYASLSLAERKSSLSSRATSTSTHLLATLANFNEEQYLRSNPDVAAAVASGVLSSGWEHFKRYGLNEGRRLRNADSVSDLRRRKMARIRPILNLELRHSFREGKYDFLNEELRARAGIVDTQAVSGHGYDSFVEALIERHADGLVLDCGAGNRPIYYLNVLNYEIVDYESTDVLGIAELLPFKDASFDAVISIAVLEHVKDPFRSASEITRVLKPGGELICCVPFLQPEHGYPHHYYNMAPQGLRALFEDKLQIDDHKVIDSVLPIWSLTWILGSWASGLQGATRDEFLSLRVNDLLGAPREYLDRAWVRELSVSKNMELASATVLFAHKAI